MRPYVLILNGSPHAEGCTGRALREVAEALKMQGVDIRLIHFGGNIIPECNGCGFCRHRGFCVINDKVNEAASCLEDASALIVGSPVYFGALNPATVAFMDRLLYSRSFSGEKTGAAVLSSWGGSNKPSFDLLQSYFNSCGMKTLTEPYSYIVHGRCAEDVEKRPEEISAMKMLGIGIAEMIRSQTVS